MCFCYSTSQFALAILSDYLKSCYLYHFVIPQVSARLQRCHPRSRQPTYPSSLYRNANWWSRRGDSPKHSLPGIWCKIGKALMEKEGLWVVILSKWQKPAENPRTIGYFLTKSKWTADAMRKQFVLCSDEARRWSWSLFCLRISELADGSLEVKLPTKWTYEVAEVGRGREEKEWEEKKSEEKGSVERRSRFQKSRRTLCVFRCVVTLEGRKVGLLKWRVRSQFGGRRYIKNCTPLWR